MRTRIIVRGIRDLDMALAAADAGADAIAFEFDRDSPRRVDLSEAFEIMSALPPMISTIGVFRDATLEEFSDAEEACPTTLAMLCGDEPQKLVRQCGPGVIRRIAWDVDRLGAELDAWGALDEVDALLIEAPEGLPAGEWHRIGPLLEQSERPIVLGGVMDGRGWADAIRAARPLAVQCIADGDGDAIEAFCREVRRIDASIEGA